MKVSNSYNEFDLQGQISLICAKYAGDYLDRFYHANTYHHVYNRGTLKSKIFFDKDDYNYFLNRLGKFSVKYKIEIMAFCLMPNHFHLLVNQTDENLKVGKFVGDLINGHTKFINKKYQRTGVVFEGPAKAKYVNHLSDNKRIVEYILSNPVIAGLSKHADEYVYSSAYEIINNVENSITCKTGLIKIYGTYENVISMIHYLSRAVPQP